jgi:LacI family transcriptional regulator
MEDFHYQDGLDGAPRMLSLLRRPTAIFAASDELARGVIEAARSVGLSVPDDLSVVGFDDTEIARIASPPLTTVRQPLQEMGAVALRTALRLVAGEKIDANHVELATELVVRASTAAAP